MNTQHSLPQSLEEAIALWDQHLNEFTVLLLDAIPVLEHADWGIEKKRVFVGESDGSKKRKQAASGPSYHSGISLNRSDAELIWHRFHVFAGAAGLDAVERIPANEQELGQNVVLSAKREELERQGIAADFGVSLPEKLPIADTDLCALIGNALDNAMEGVQGVPDPQVTVRCKADKGLFMLQVLNPVGGTVHPDLSTTKADKQAHGFGLPGMEEIARRYHGTQEAKVRNGQFELVICFPIPQNPN